MKRRGEVLGTVNLNMMGRHNVQNLTAAMAVAGVFMIPLGELRGAVESLDPAPMRGAPRRVGELEIIDDCYNSNPAAAQAALDFLGAASWDHSAAANRLNCTSSQLLKLLRKEPAAMISLNLSRKSIGLGALR